MKVRKLRLAVVISAGVHAAVVAWVSTFRFAAHPAVAPTEPPAQIEVVTVEPPPEPAAPLDVALLEPAASPATAAAVPGAPPRVRSAAPPTAPAPSTPLAIVAQGRGSADETAPPVTHSPLMAMRRDEPAMRRTDAPQLALPKDRWDDLDHPPTGTSPEHAPTTGMLHESGGGTRKSDQGVFVAHVKADGTVKLSDRPNFHIHLALPTVTDLGHGLARWYTTERGTFGEPLAPGSTDVGKAIQVTSGASTDQADPRSGNTGDRASTVLVPVFGGGFDVNDWLMRGRVGDPYASRKLAMLDATRDERVQIGNRHRADQLKQSTQIMRRNLESLWAATPDPVARKQALFEMWDECAEAGDPALVEAGEAARRLVIGFIRSRIPAGGPGAFTAAELAVLARAQQSKAAFLPYDAAP
jgi:hypothetical protein